MSRRTRPQRRVRGAERDRLRDVVADGWLDGFDGRWFPYERRAERLGCRPSQLRRCLLGLPVSARAAAKILAASCRPNIRREPGR